MKKAQTGKSDFTATLGSESKLRYAAYLMRDKLPAAQYRQVLMGFLFLRYVSDAFRSFRDGKFKKEEGFAAVADLKEIGVEIG